MKRKVFVFFLVFLIIAACSYPALASNETTNGGELLKQMLENNQQDMKISTDSATKKQNSILAVSSSVEDTINSDGDMCDAYGGLYIDEKGDLVVNMTSKTAMEDFSSCVDEIVSSQPAVESDVIDINVKCKLVSDSAKELDEIYEKFNDAFYTMNTASLTDTQNELLSRWVSYGVDYKNNCVNVYVQNFSQSDKETFESVFGKYDSVKYHSQEVAEVVDTYKPGRAIFVASTKEGTSDLIFKKVSIAFRAKKNNRAGFVTCAHGIHERTSNFVYITNSLTQSNVIGRVYENGFETSSDTNKIDYSFVLLMNNNSVSNEANSTTVSTIGEVVQGMTVWKIGATTGVTSSTVTEPRSTTKYSSRYSSWIITEIAKTGDFCKAGDSGGLVYSQQSSASTYQIVGIVSGGIAGSESYFTRADSVCEASGIVAY